MKKKGKVHAKTVLTFSEFVGDPVVTLSLLVFALIALFLSILEFANAISYF